MRSVGEAANRVASRVRSPSTRGKPPRIVTSPLPLCGRRPACGRPPSLLASPLHGSIRGIADHGQPGPHAIRRGVPALQSYAQLWTSLGMIGLVRGWGCPGRTSRATTGGSGDRWPTNQETWVRCGTGVIADLSGASANSGASTLSSQQRAFLRLTRPLGLIDGTALLAAPSEFAKDAIERILRRPISDALGRHLGVEVNLAVVVDASAASGGTEVPDPAGRAGPRGVRCGSGRGTPRGQRLGWVDRRLHRVGVRCGRHDGDVGGDDGRHPQRARPHAQRRIPTPPARARPRPGRPTPARPQPTRSPSGRRPG